MAGTTVYQENVFIDQLKKRLSNDLGWKVHEETENGQIDLVVEHPLSGKRIFIEFKEAGRYGQLPLSTVLSLNRQKNRLSAKDVLCLVSFSAIPAVLKNQLGELGILAIERPTVQDASGKIEQAMMA